ncbi:protein of unknown function [Cupriavidus taiwanensis]|nr:protein of unknown function [Cupriavidus taiwanensis]
MRARCRHRGRGIAAGAPGADAQDRVDQARRLRRALRHHERGRAVADRHHDADGGGRLGAMQGRHVRLAARACRSGQAVGTDALRRTGRDRRRPQAGSPERRRDQPVLAPRPVAERHRPGTRPAGEGRRVRPGPEAGVRMIANARMYAVAPQAEAAWRALLACVSVRAGVALPYARHPRRRRSARCGRGRTAAACSCAAIRTRARR